MCIAKNLAVSAVLLLSLSLAACGGGGADGAPPVAVQPSAQPLPSPVVAIEGNGVVGKIGPNFTTITVNGKDFDTTDSALTVTVDDLPAIVADLAVGNVVIVQALSDDGGNSAMAMTIDQRNRLDGPIRPGSIDLNAGTFVVLGQTVRVSATTVFDDGISPPSLDGLADGDLVEVSGLADSDGVITATRVERQTNPGSFEVFGIVSALDTVNFRFNISDLVVDYSAATLRDFANGGPQNGDPVEVKGSAIGANGELIATDVEGKKPGFSGADGDVVEIEGFVTRFASASDFDIAGLPVSTTNQTQFERGTSADLMLNVRLEAKGTLDTNGVLVASKIEFKTGADQADVRIEAAIDAVDPGTGVVTILGLSVTVDGNTLLEDKSDADVATFGLGDLHSGDYVEMRGFEEPIGSRNIVAVRLEREDFDSDTILRGPVESLMDPSLKIFGVTINTSSTTRFEDRNDLPISRADFFATARAGGIVKAKGFRNGDSIDAEELEFED